MEVFACRRYDLPMSFVLPKEARGLYRTPGWAYVTDETTGLDVPEGRYRVAGYYPDYDDLPTKEAYEAANKSGPAKNAPAAGGER